MSTLLTSLHPEDADEHIRGQKKCKAISTMPKVPSLLGATVGLPAVLLSAPAALSA